MGRRRIRIRDAVIICTIILIAFVAGTTYGSTNSLNWCVKTGINFIEAKGVNISIDKEEIYQLIGRYKTAIGEGLNITK